jgi:hypothetical protein
MQHHRCFRVYITKTRATRISDTVYFKHQYITNLTVSPKSHVVAAAQQLAAALEGNIPAGNKMAEALKKVSKLFTKIAATKNEAAKAKEQRNRVRATPAARKTTHFPRVEALIPRVAAGPEEDCRVDQIVANLSVPRPVVHASATRSQSRSPRFDAQSPAARRPNYISQDEDDQHPPMRRTTRSASNSIMQEAMLSCMDIYKPQYVASSDLGILNFVATVLTGTTHMVTPQQMSVCRIPMTWFRKMANSVIGNNGELLEYLHLIANHATRATWQHSYGNEIGRLAQGMPGRNAGTNTIVFIKKNQVPQDRAKDVTNGLITTLIRPEKLDKPNRTRLVAGGDRVHYPGDAGTPTADLLTIKLLLNSIISTPKAKFMTMDIKAFYLNTPMAWYEYMRLQITDMPEDVIAHYKLTDIATLDGYIYCEIQKGMYGLPQAGIIAQQLLEKRLKAHGYHQSTITPGLWKHDTHPISFSLVVDDFRVKYVGEESAQHLLDTVQKYYKCSCDWEGERYCGLTIKWDYEGRKVHISMPGYPNKATGSTISPC